MTGIAPVPFVVAHPLWRLPQTGQCSEALYPLCLSVFMMPIPLSATLLATPLFKKIGIFPAILSSNGRVESTRVRRHPGYPCGISVTPILSGCLPVTAA